MRDQAAKLLSHRLRQFGAVEQTASALTAACGSGVRFLEIDTRVSRDGDVFVYHDPTLRHATGSSTRIRDLDSHEIQRVLYPDGSHILRLEEALSIFRCLGGAEQTLCLDIKDAGFEVTHLDLLRKYDLEHTTCILSWCPQILSTMRHAGCVGPLVLCHCNLTRFRWLASIPLTCFRNLALRFSDFVLLGPNSYRSELTSQSHGYQHAYFCQTIPDPVCQLLSESGGGICIHTLLLCRRLIEYCMSNSLTVWTFSTTARSYNQFASIPGVNVVFCDDAPAIIARQDD